MNQVINHFGAAPQGRPKYFVPKCEFFVRHLNPGASDYLVIPMNLICNTPDEDLIANVTANSALDRAWVGTKPAHDGVALVCGGGPSLEDDLETIRQMAKGGGVIFAMNGAASFLVKNGIAPDYQVIADAREQTADLVEPAARNHWFASQAHPAAFARAPEACVFHVNLYNQIADFENLIKDFGSPEFALVGNHGSVGNVSLTLVYARGFRNIHVFGFDSSFREKAGHAYEQPMNSTEPVAVFEYGDKKYVCTFTMKGQADVFPRLAYDLQDMGCSFTVHGSGYLPDRWNGERAKTVEQREADKYREIWTQDAYRQFSPGAGHVEDAIAKLGIKAGDTLMDFGCGTGRATKDFLDRGVKAAGTDFAPNALEEDVPFTLAALWDLHVLGPIADWAFCCDVMEHIPPERVDIVLRNIANTIGLRGAYFAIDSTRDDMGQIIGQTLHMTVRPPEWWREQLSKHFASVEQHEGGVFVCLHQSKGKSNGTP